MPASSYAALYDFAGNLAAAAKAVLVADKTTLIGADTNADTDAFIFGPRENLSMPPDRITVSADAFTQASDQQIRATSNSEWFFAHFAGRLIFRVQTPRSVPLAAAEHASRVGRIVYLMQPRARKFTAENLPLYEIIALRLTGLPRAEYDEEEDVDFTELTFDAGLWILPGSFPETLT
jgi:hypothetical protein